MGSYLQTYGVEDARRGRAIKAILLIAGVLFVLVVAGYFFFHNFPERQKVKRFLSEINAHDYKAAYAMWGCTDAHPCPQYAFNKFLEDWGPQSKHADIAAAKLAKTKSCDTGIIQFVEFPGNDEVQLWVERRDKVLGFAPWPVCNPRMPVP